MDMIPIQSGNLVSIGYDEYSKTLRVKLKSSTYDFNKVPKHVYLNFLYATNKNKYFHSHIRGKFSIHKRKKD